MPRIVNYPLSTRDQKKRQVTFDWDFVSAGYARTTAEALDEFLDSVDFEPQQW